MALKKTLINKIIPLVAVSLFSIGTLIGIQGDHLKYKEVHERFPQAKRNVVYGHISNLKELNNTTIEGIKELEEKASEKYRIAAPLIILGGLSFLGASTYRPKK